MRRTKFLLLVIAAVLFAHTVMASSGSITTPHTAKVCHDSTCTTPTPGSINFQPTGVSPVLIDTVTGLSGMVWGNELGWINLHPTGAGVTFLNPLTGVLTGKAWSQVSGWINFAVTGQQVKIDPSTGNFSGWAWTGGPYGGWVKFDCGDPSSCVATTWREISPPSVPSGGGGNGGRPPADVCPNIDGIQASIPSGYTVSADGSCVVVVDVCPNIVGVQNVVPEGFAINTIGACVVSIDYCPNISGIQTSVPAGDSVTITGACVPLSPPTATDACPDVPGLQSSSAACTVAVDQCRNISGNQSEIPQGYIQNGTDCFPTPFDICKNIAGNQTALPDGDTIDADGNCVPLPVDLCSNLGGYQSVVPQGFELTNGVCLFKTPATEQPPQQKPVVAFPFIPKQFQVPVDTPVLKSAVQSLGYKAPADKNYSVDAVSTTVSLFGLLFLLFLLFRMGRL